jgi:hypothetical protein
MIGYGFGAGGVGRAGKPSPFCPYGRHLTGTTASTAGHKSENSIDERVGSKQGSQNEEGQSGPSEGQQAENDGEDAANEQYPPSPPKCRKQDQIRHPSPPVTVSVQYFGRWRSDRQSLGTTAIFYGAQKGKEKNCLTRGV